MEQTQPLLSNQQVNSTAGTVSVRFCVHKPAGCCPSICCCNREEFINATQVVVPDTTTVGEFLRIVNEINQPKNEYTFASINGFQLHNNDLIAPTIRSFEKFAAPIVIVPKEACCLLI